MQCSENSSCSRKSTIKIHQSCKRPKLVFFCLIWLLNTKRHSIYCSIIYDFCSLIDKIYHILCYSAAVPHIRVEGLWIYSHDLYIPKKSRNATINLLNDIEDDDVCLWISYRHKNLLKRPFFRLTLQNNKLIPLDFFETQWNNFLLNSHL